MPDPLPTGKRAPAPVPSDLLQGIPGAEPRPPEGPIWRDPANAQPYPPEGPISPLPQMAGGQKEPMPNAPEKGGAVGIGIIQGLKEGQAPPLPKDAPLLNMHPRHMLENADFFQAAERNSYLLERISEAKLQRLYQEAFFSGPRQGYVQLQNRQTWFINKDTGKFFPAQGPGIINLTQQEVGLLDDLTKQIKKGVAPEQALKNLSRAMSGQKYTVTESMEAVLSKLAPKMGYTSEALGKAVAPHLPKSSEMALNEFPPEARAKAAAKAGTRVFRFVKSGGRVLLVVGIGLDAIEVYYAENKKKTITKKIGFWVGAWRGGVVGARSGAALAVGLGFAGPQAAAPEEVVTVPLFGIIGGIGGALIGGWAFGTATETVWEWVFEFEEGENK